MHVGRNETAIAYHNHLSSAAFSIAAEAMRLIDMQERKDGSGIDKGPEFVRKNSERDDGHSIPLVQGIGEGHKRHIMSSSRGTRGTEGIFPGAIARAVSSTSLPEFPTAASVLFTTATYLPAYLVTSSLQCSTIQRSSLAIAAPPMHTKALDLLYGSGRGDGNPAGIRASISSSCSILWSFPS